MFRRGLKIEACNISPTKPVNNYDADGGIKMGLKNIYLCLFINIPEVLVIMSLME